jgi:hypothetical protein
MRRVCLTLTAVFLFLFGYSQPAVGTRHAFKQNAELTEVSPVGVATPNKEFVPASAIFRIDGITSAGYVIHFDNWNLPSNKDTDKLAAVKARNIALASGSGIQKYFLIPTADFQNWTETVGGSFSVFASSTIVKIRPGRKEPINNYPVYFDFANDVNLGILAGYTFRPRRVMKGFAFSTLGGFAVSSIPVDAATTQDFVTSSGNQAAITPSFAFVGQHGNFQLGVLGGIDLMAGEVGKKWIFRNRPWIGVGIGFNLFRSQGTGSQE